MIYGKKINLRAIERKDIEKFRQWRNNSEIRKRCREFKLINPTKQEQWYEDLTQDYNEIMFSIEINHNQLIGCCGLCYIDWHVREAEVSIYIGSSKHQNKGYATDALFTLVDYGFQEVNLHRIWAEIYEFNIPSIKLFEKVGFKREGQLRENYFVDGRYWDSYRYSILENEWLNIS